MPPVVSSFRPCLEIAVDDLEGALAAAGAGADRIELCAALELGGLTPSAGLLAAVRAAVRVPVLVMLRPRAGDFCYTPGELDVILRDLATARAAGADGVVCGALRTDGTLDRDALAAIVAATGPLPVTCHRAFDFVPDQAAGLEQLIELRIARVLTSARAAVVADALPALSDLVAHAQARIEVIAGGGVRRGNVRAVAATGVRAVHSGARMQLTGAAGPNLAAGSGDTAALARGATDVAEVAALAAALRAR
jgi:copper homeostasis protein